MHVKIGVTQTPNPGNTSYSVDLADDTVWDPPDNIKIMQIKNADEGY